MSYLIWIPTALMTAVAMDVWAALLHGKVWHRWLWFIHRTHHEPQPTAFELNDLLSTLHAPIAIALIVYGCEAQGIVATIAFGIGIGMTLFGIGYLLIHDGLVHQRLPLQGLLRFKYFRMVLSAHRAHHAHTHAPPYGIFLAPWELRHHLHSRETPPRPQ